MNKNLFRFKCFDLEMDKSVMPLTSDAFLLGSWARVDVCAKTCLDIGTGTGVLSLMLAQRFNERLEEIVAIDIDDTSAILAARNFMASPWSAILNARHCAFQELSESLKFDSVICNPPFYTPTDQKMRDVNTRSKHNDLLSLDSLVNGLDRHTHDKSIVSLILPSDKSDEIKKYISNSPLRVTRECAMIPFKGAPIKRVLLELKKEGSSIESDQIIMYESNRKYTKDYKSLTTEFYL